MITRVSIPRIFTIVLFFTVILVFSCGSDDLPPPTFGVSGSVFLTGSGEALSDIDVVIQGVSGGTTTTSQSGEYSFDGLRQGESYTIDFNAGGTNPLYGQQRRPTGQIDRDIKNFNVTLVSTRGDILGVVKNALNSEPLEGVRVTISPGNESVTTGTDGIYVFDRLSEIEYTLQFMKAGFESDAKKQTVVAGQVQNGDISLTPIIPITVEPSQLNFGTSLSSRTFRVINETSEELSFEIQYVDKWLNLDKDLGKLSGLNSDLVGINVDRTLLVPGSYTGEVVVNVPGRGSKSIEITIEQLDEAEGILEISEGLVEFGQLLDSRFINLTYSGNQLLTWSSESSETWLTTSLKEGFIEPKGSKPLEILVDRSQLSTGEYSGQLIFESNGRATSIEITLTVAETSNEPPVDLVVTSGLSAFLDFENNDFGDRLGNFVVNSRGVGETIDSPEGVGNAANFPAGSYLEFEQNPFFNETLGDIHGSVSLWIKTSKGGSLMSVPYSNSSDNNEFAMGFINGQLRHSISNYSNRSGGTTQWGQFDVSAQNLPLDDRWHMFTLTYDALNKRCTFYRDGVRFSSDEYKINQALTASILRIGIDFYEGAADVGLPYFEGRIDNIRIYNRPLTDSEVSAIASAGK